MRVGEALNRALHDLMAADPDVHLLGEDLADPYGGAFKITKGLSTRFGDRVRSTPLSEGGIVGVGAGLALAGGKAIVEIMFADFVALAFDQLLNFASKSTTMYGRPVPLPMIVRCPGGGNRGYGPTHSQSPQKHFIGAPGLEIYELTPFHDPGDLLTRMLDRRRPCMLFEDKVLYTRELWTGGPVGELFTAELTGGVARVFMPEVTEPDCVIIAHGGVADRVIAAMTSLIVEADIACELLVPDRLYPLPGSFATLPALRSARHVCVVEDGSEGGSWGAEVARVLYPSLWSSLRRPIGLIGAADSIIPAAPHLERTVLPQPDRIHREIAEALA